MTLEQLQELQFEIQVAHAVNVFTRGLIEHDLKVVEEEIINLKIVNLCLTGE